MFGIAMTDRPDIILGLDVGTTAAKASLFSLDGTVRLTASREYPLLGPRPPASRRYGPPAGSSARRCGARSSPAC